MPGLADWAAAGCAAMAAKKAAAMAKADFIGIPPQARFMERVLVFRLAIVLNLTRQLGRKFRART